MIRGLAGVRLPGGVDEQAGEPRSSVPIQFRFAGEVWGMCPDQ